MSAERVHARRDVQFDPASAAVDPGPELPGPVASAQLTSFSLFLPLPLPLVSRRLAPLLKVNVQWIRQ